MDAVLVCWKMVLGANSVLSSYLLVVAGSQCLAEIRIVVVMIFEQMLSKKWFSSEVKGINSYVGRK